MKIADATQELLRSIHADEVDLLRHGRRLDHKMSDVAKVRLVAQIHRLEGRIEGKREAIAQLDALSFDWQWPIEDTIAMPIAHCESERTTLVFDAVYEPLRVRGVVCDSTRYTISVQVGVEWVIESYRPTIPNVPRPARSTPLWCYPGMRLLVKLDRAPYCSDHDECRIDDEAHRAQAAICSLRPSVRLFVERASITTRSAPASALAAAGQLGYGAGARPLGVGFREHRDLFAASSRTSRIKR